MSSKDAGVEVALLEIAKDLLQASDDLAATDPSASAKLAHEAYEIGRDLGIVRDHLEPTVGVELANTEDTSVSPLAFDDVSNYELTLNGSSQRSESQERVVEEDGDDELFRILDRQRDVVPKFSELLPARNARRRTSGHVRFEVSTSRRTGWFSWMRSREVSHAG